MNPEGLKQRLNEKAAAFLQQLFARLLKAELGSASAVPNEIPDHFSTDSDSRLHPFQVPDSLTEHYPGAGGCGHTVGVKIQL
jgi:hypothetical protein